MGSPQQVRSNKQLSVPADAAGYHHSHCVPRSERRIGHEWEIFIVDRHGQPISYEGQNGGSGYVDVLKGFMKQDPSWQPQTDGKGGPLIGLKRVVPGGDPCHGADSEMITSEPGGAVEWSSAASRRLSALGDRLKVFHSQFSQALEGTGMTPLGAGWLPTQADSGILRVPKTRYQEMFRYMSQDDRAGACDTCSVQATFDYHSEKDAVEKARLSLALMPLATAFANNSPSRYGVLGNLQSERMERWNRYMADQPEDTKRVGNMPFVFESDFGFKSYAERMAKLPLMFVVDAEGRYQPGNGKTFGDTIKGGEANHASYANFLTSTTYDIRLKGQIEVRQMDSTSDPRLVMAYTALWTGLLYDDKSRRAALELAAPWSQSTRDQMRLDVPRHGLATPIGQTGRTLQDLASEVLPLSVAGLKRMGEDPGLLAPLYDIMEHGNPAQQLLKKLSLGAPAGEFNRLVLPQGLALEHYNVPDARKHDLWSRPGLRPGM